MHDIDPFLFPLRINRYLALKGIATRRAADVLVASGSVKINGRVARVGDKVAESDVVTCDETRTAAHTYLAYYKPRSVLTHATGNREKEIKEIRKDDKVFPVGRLDKDSEGLIILTDDGRITDRLLNPEYEHEKEYLVTVDVPLKPSFKSKMERGVIIEGYTTKPAKISVADDTQFRITLTEGKKHQIRRMCAALGYQVRSLKRTRIMNIKLGSLKPNQSRVIAGTELNALLAALHLPR